MIKVGAVCKCEQNSIGIVTQCVRKNGRVVKYKGITLVGGDWQSTEPTPLADNMLEYVRDCVDDAIDDYNTYQGPYD